MRTPSLELRIDTEEKMHELGVRLGRILKAGDVLSLNGPLGAGKTTLTRGIGEGLQVSGNVSSPTFLIAREHPTATGTPFVHVDAYRLSSPDELFDLDIDFQNSISAIEWGSGYADGLTESVLVITISRELETEKRTLHLEGSGRFSDPAKLLGEAK